ncbi:hypothetical protein K443DRAFT_111345, partial [Laccaria amethystina LaAM-08-1]
VGRGRCLGDLTAWREAAAFVAQRRNGSGSGLANFERGNNSLIQTAHCPLPPHDPQSTHHRLQCNPG